ncbi:hypothetical protein V6N13_115674 [Hibiscus sabdariffa]|uniref:Uncharacterized protein n=1 Tax=Hibiscus sabdariffa TaxID=183260 RepID=A0ABR2CT73_9ROSI
MVTSKKEPLGRNYVFRFKGHPFSDDVLARNGLGVKSSPPPYAALLSPLWCPFSFLHTSYGKHIRDPETLAQPPIFPMINQTKDGKCRKELELHAILQVSVDVSGIVRTRTKPTTSMNMAKSVSYVSVAQFLHLKS